MRFKVKRLLPKPRKNNRWNHRIFASSEADFEVITRKVDSGRTSPPYAVETFKIFSPLAMLYAACRYQQSKLFFTIVVNLARFALSCRWLIPKYCSTMYRTLDNFLLRSISNSVNLAVVESFLMMPSCILFKARKSRLGLPAYPLSAYTFWTDCFV